MKSVSVALTYSAIAVAETAMLPPAVTSFVLPRPIVAASSLLILSASVLLGVALSWWLFRGRWHLARAVASEWQTGLIGVSLIIVPPIVSLRVAFECVVALHRHNWRADHGRTTGLRPSELLGMREVARETLAAAGLVWPEDYSAIDLDYEVQGIEVLGIQSQRRAMEVLTLLKHRLNWLGGHVRLKDWGTLDRGWAVLVSPRDERPGAERSYRSQRSA
jgi:hypothetical protein